MNFLDIEYQRGRSRALLNAGISKEAQARHFGVPRQALVPYQVPTDFESPEEQEGRDLVQREKGFMGGGYGAGAGALGGAAMGGLAGAGISALSANPDIKKLLSSWGMRDEGFLEGLGLSGPDDEPMVDQGTASGIGAAIGGGLGALGGGVAGYGRGRMSAEHVNNPNSLRHLFGRKYNEDRDPGQSAAMLDKFRNSYHTRQALQNLQQKGDLLAILKR